MHSNINTVCISDTRGNTDMETPIYIHCLLITMYQLTIGRSSHHLRVCALQADIMPAHCIFIGRVISSRQTFTIIIDSTSL